DQPEADHPAVPRARRLRRRGRPVPRGRDDLVPQSRLDRSGARVPDLGDAHAMHTVLEAADVTKEYREGLEVVPVLRGVSLSLARGEIVSLEGPSGSGKTTLLSILGCILTPTAGRVVVEGEEVDPRRPARLPAIRRKSIGFVFQQF